MRGREDQNDRIVVMNEQVLVNLPIENRGEDVAMTSQEYLANLINERNIPNEAHVDLSSLND